MATRDPLLVVGQKTGVVPLDTRKALLLVTISCNADGCNHLDSNIVDEIHICLGHLQLNSAFSAPKYFQSLNTFQGALLSKLLYPS